MRSPNVQNACVKSTNTENLEKCLQLDRMEIQKEIKCTCNKFPILFFEKITTEVRNFFSSCNLNVKLPDVCLMLEELKLCII